MRLEVTLIPNIGKENLNNRVYAREVVDKIIEDFKPGMLGHLGFTENIEHLIVENSSHKVNKIFIKDNNLMGEIELLDTKSGNIVKIIMENSVVRPRGIGSINKDGNIGEDYKILSFDIIDKKNDVFKNID